MSDSNSVDWDAVGAVTGVLSIIVTLIGFEWKVVRSRLLRLLRLRPKGAQPSPRFTPASILAAASASVSVVSVTIAGIIAHQDSERPAQARAGQASAATSTSPKAPPQAPAQSVSPDKLALAAKAKEQDPPPVPARSGRAMGSQQLPKPTRELAAAPPSPEPPSQQSAPQAVATNQPRYKTVPWGSYPSTYAINGMKSKAALDERKAGSAIVSCVLAPGARLWTDCKVDSETPTGYGFGDTALKIVAASTISYDEEIATLVGKRVPLTIVILAN